MAKGPHPPDISVSEWVCRENIKRFRVLLDENIPGAPRRTLERLLENEHQRLAEILGAHGTTGHEDGPMKPDGQSCGGSRT